MSFYEFFDTDHKNRVQILGADIFRVTHFREKKNKDTFIDPPWYKHIVQNLDNQDESDFTIELTGNLTRIIGKHGRICFAEKKIQHDRGGGFILLSKIENESFYGWGEWFNHFERKKGKIHLSSHESPELLQGHLTYSTIPLFISSQNYLFFLLSSYPSDWVIDATEIKIKPGEGQLDYLVICGESPKDLISKYTGLTGRPRLIPRWGFGLWATCYPQENQFKVLQFARTHRERQIPLDVIVLDYHWEERFHNFQWRKKLFPDPEQLITDLKKMDIKLGLIFTPFLNDQNQPVRKTIFNYLLKNIPKGCERDDERTIDAYQEAQSAGYLAHEHAEWWFGKGGMFDFTYPEGTIWWNTRMQKLYDSGIALFKNDDGEYLPKKSRSHIGMSSNEYHNIYGFYFGRAIYEGMEQLDERRGMIYSRSVWAGSQRYPAMFLGDQHPNFKNIQKTMTAGLNLSLAGFAYWGADILGLDGKTTPETHMRYTQWAIFSPIARYFFRPEQIDSTRQPWLQSEEVEAHFRNMVNLRYRLLPYYYSCAWTAYKTGIPIIRPVFMEFPEDNNTWAIHDQVMIGEGLLLAPVVKAGALSRRVYFPEGEWYDFWSQKKTIGGRFINVDAPLKKVPLFVKSGTILPLGPGIASINENHAFSQLELHFWGMGEGSHLIYDDDGTTRNYLSGSYLETEIRSQSVPGVINVCITPLHNGYLQENFKRIYKFVMHDFDRPVQIISNDNRPSRFVYETENRSIHFVLEAEAKKSYSIKINF